MHSFCFVGESKRLPEAVDFGSRRQGLQKCGLSKHQAVEIVATDYGAGAGLRFRGTVRERVCASSWDHLHPSEMSVSKEGFKFDTSYRQEDISR